MLEISDIELPDTAVSSNRCEDVSLLGEVYVINFFIVSDKLCEDGTFLDIPDGAGGIDGAGTYEVVHLWVPVEGGEGC